MKTDEEFLDRMWESISQIEYEQMLEQCAKQLDSKIRKQKIILYITIISICILSILINLEFSYMLCSLVLFVGYYLESNFEYKTFNFEKRMKK